MTNIFKQCEDSFLQLTDQRKLLPYYEKGRRNMSIIACPSGHKLVEWTDREFDQLHTCMTCGAVSKSEETGLCCTSNSPPSCANHSLCLGCVSAACGLVCRNGHALSKASIGPQASCDLCGEFTAPCPTQMVCLTCDYVCCHRCVIQRGLAAGGSYSPPVPPGEQAVEMTAVAVANKPASDDLVMNKNTTSAHFARVVAAKNAGSDRSATYYDPQAGSLNNLRPVLHWYAVQLGSDGSFAGYGEASSLDTAFLLQRPTRQVYFQDGLLADVTSAVGNRFEIAQKPRAATGAVIYFTLPEWFDQVPTDTMKEYAPFPDVYVDPLAAERFAISAAAGLLDDENAGISEAYQKYHAHTHGSWAEKWIGSGDWLFRVQSVASTILLTLLCVFALWLNIVICQAIGGSTAWEMVFLWLFLGNFGYCALFMLPAYLIPRLLGGKDDNNPIAKMAISSITLFVFCASFGAPLAWTKAQIKSGEDYLAEERTKTINCWRNPNERIEQIAHHFVVFEEADWVVDYKRRFNQGVSTLIGTNDEDQDDGKRYNFCIAPMAYRGLPNCPQNFYAACFRETSSKYLASCDDNDAKICGWDFPSAGNLLRTMNRNEQFWSGIVEEDQQHWDLATTYATPFTNAPVSNVVGFYSGEGPNEIQEYVDTATSLDSALLTSALSVIAGVTLLIIFSVNRLDSC